ncbi:sugar transferase [Ruminococcus flavefaciens]|uniref:Exopolysaccharide biosynthesis polyprenyl glycosylphosphotransferase n=2 Tax=Ruminococcus TaxID=1263 RepID=A0A315Y2A6_RUMFL|nr:sugar transferase [Ruminococcus flavefaciens]PWJ12703.1 exopolysaccharide biosynthesis polyprenyl glycosylphosphotransferase [Ruminococcus flavefaciens]SSA49354.1 exopolysaccharide biosynthesis polyprenyl glycosylphosphotransferase [Ruminococcus flavefaciens]
MENKSLKEGLKHADFIIIDLLCLQLCFIVSYWLHLPFENPYGTEAFQYQAVILTTSQLLVIVFTNNYRGILRRGRLDELWAVIKYIAEVMILALIYLFAVKHSTTASRLQLGLTSVTYTAADYVFRQLGKLRVFNSSKYKQNRRSVVLITSGGIAEQTLSALMSDPRHSSFFISGVIITDRHCESGEKLGEVPVYALDSETIYRLSHGWVDEVFLLQSEDMTFPSELMNSLFRMGITVNYSITPITDGRWNITEMRSLGPFRVLSSSVSAAPAGKLAVKRLADIAGGLVGCVLTLIVFLFLAPIIYVKSPGPIFFKQKRVGQNGKPFVMYKFRSMYMDAEKRKQELMEKNRIGSGMMFKMDDDPRIIGSEKKDKNGRPKGIGNFIRRHSIDELPQFFNVLIGNMSLVGTRPPTPDEWEKYGLGHRIRMSIKPGLTGLWQVSGRSRITDFEEVVRLDREYIENWSLLLDAKIILKTVAVVLRASGAE